MSEKCLQLRNAAAHPGYLRSDKDKTHEEPEGYSSSEVPTT